MTKYKIHPVAALFPMLADDELNALAEDIKKNGLRDRIVTCGEWIIDGRNRLKACGIAGVEPQYREEKTSNIAAYIASTNVLRRHLTTQQRSAIAAEMATLEHGTNQYEKKAEGSFDPSTEALTLEQAATLMNVSRKTVVRAKNVMKNDPEAHEKAKAGIKTPRKKQEKKSKPKYSGFDVAYQEGLLASQKTGASTAKLKADMLAMGIEIHNPDHEQRLRAACKELLAQRDPAAAEKRVEAIKETLTKPQRENFEKKFEDAVSLRAHQHIVERVEEAVGSKEAELLAKEKQLNEWAEDLAAQQADITAYMTEEEFKLVLGCLHPDRAGDDQVLRKRLDRAFGIFNRLKSYIRKYPVSVMRERGWA